MTAVVEEPVGELLAGLAQLPSGHPSTWDLEELRTGIPTLFALSNQLASLQYGESGTDTVPGGDFMLSAGTLDSE